MKDSQSEQKSSRKPISLTLGDIGLAVGLTLGAGYSLFANDAYTVGDVMKNFVDKGYIPLTGFTTIGYSIGRFIEVFRR